MLIFNQNKESIINLERVKEISLFEPFENDTEVWIYADDILLGSYKNFSIAQSIFKDILHEYELQNSFSSGFVSNRIYYMPKE